MGTKVSSNPFQAAELRFQAQRNPKVRVLVDRLEASFRDGKLTAPELNRALPALLRELGSDGFTPVWAALKSALGTVEVAPELRRAFGKLVEAARPFELGGSYPARPAVSIEVAAPRWVDQRTEQAKSFLGESVSALLARATLVESKVGQGRRSGTTREVSEYRFPGSSQTFRRITDSEERPRKVLSDRVELPKDVTVFADAAGRVSQVELDGGRCSFREAPARGHLEEQRYLGERRYLINHRRPEDQGTFVVERLDRNGLVIDQAVHRGWSLVDQKKYEAEGDLYLERRARPS